jgi:amidase
MASQPQLPPKWQLVAWQKKDEQYVRIPSDWRIPHGRLHAPKATNYLSIPSTCGILSDEELRITENYDATALAEAIRGRKLECVDVARAFCKVRQLFEGVHLYRWDVMDADTRFREPL